VICSYIRRGSEKEITRYDEGEFEKKFSFFREILELVLKIPFTLSAVGVGKLIAQSTNSALGSEVISLKAVEALAQNSTKLSFFILDRDFYEGKVKFLESYFLFLEDYFKNPVCEQPMCSSYFFEENWSVGLTQHELGSSKSPTQSPADETSRKLLEDPLLDMSKIGEAIHRIVVSAFG
jgi:hypothetical protein